MKKFVVVKEMGGGGGKEGGKEMFCSEPATATTGVERVGTCRIGDVAVRERG